jgi:deoxyadenosine/deoxycytidine kinase
MLLRSYTEFSSVLPVSCITMPREHDVNPGMVKLIAVIGNWGSGKTTLTRRLSEQYGFVPLMEQHQERPFQARFRSDLKKYSLANQMDYLLFRAEQELSLQGSDTIGIADGGLEQDFHVFTALFHRKGYLDEHEYRICERLYKALRQTLPLPDLLIRLSAPLDVLRRRRAARSRELDIVEGMTWAQSTRSSQRGWRAIRCPPSHLIPDKTIRITPSRSALCWANSTATWRIPDPANRSIAAHTPGNSPGTPRVCR